ncbi:hypothetical protein [Xanthobacter agilis]|uniref:GH18 domain-containing protein n=1 Tax=Xanthobacter agilis TaxID=47492 RepID=A0ABU0L9Z6_XANAG|nr:hypothetical protein [Xanthobacter agilis]MDQ0503963.1 hypothetical protein [Xanthobacter agilis]
MTISVVSGGAVSDAASVTARFALGTMDLIGPAAAGAPVMARVRLPLVPFKAIGGGAQQVSGLWFGTVRRAGPAETFRLVSGDGSLVLTGAVGSDLKLDAATLAYGEVLDITSGQLSMGAGGSLALSLAGKMSVPEPSGQEFHVHWDSWYEKPDPAYPERFYLTNLPPYVSTVTLCFARPQVTYEGLDDNVFATTGLQFQGTGHQLKNALDLLRLRRPGIRVALAVQQGGPLGFEPYNREGWAGMNGTHFRALALFLEQMGIRDIDVDYECVASSMDGDKHCLVKANRDVWCYTDGELVRVIKAFRDKFPRPKFRLAFDAYNTGAYFGPFARQAPVGWNHGYVAALARDPKARAAIDIINIMSFDEKPGYDPARALEAYQYHFPDAQVFLGLRSGPAWHGDVKRSLTDVIDFANAAIRLKAGGLWLYSLLWDAGEPHGPYGPDNPDANMMARLVAERFRLPGADLPLVSTGA